MKKKYYTFDIKMNSIESDEVTSKNEVEFILHDFEESHNKSIIKKESAMKVLDSITNMPIVCKYNPTIEGEDDALGGHEVSLGEDREGNIGVDFGTTPIGVFTESAYIKTVFDENGVEKEVVAAKGILWAERYPNAVGLLQEWSNKGIEVRSSMEISYTSYLYKDDVEEILDFNYIGHCILNSEDRGEHKSVAPAYDISRLTKMMSKDINKESEEIKEMEKFTKVFELSHSDIRTKLYGVLEPLQAKDTHVWISDVYDTYFIANEYSWAEDNEFDKNYKYDFTRTGDEVTVAIESKSEVQAKREWIAVSEVTHLEALHENATFELEKAKTQISELKTESEKVTKEKVKVEVQFNDTADKLIKLDSVIEELTPFKEQFEKSQYEARLSVNTAMYEGKFTALNSEDKFKEESVQALLKQASHETTEGKDAKLQLNSMLVDLVEVKPSEPKEKEYIQVSSKRENLVPVDSFESKYFMQ